MLRSKGIEPTALERHREAVIVGRKVWGQENEVHRSLAQEELTKYTNFWPISDFQLKQDLCAFGNTEVCLFYFGFVRWTALLA
jgi:hypothetical protein